jgi:hypothetical protein
MYLKAKCFPRKKFSFASSFHTSSLMSRNMQQEKRMKKMKQEPFYQGQMKLQQMQQEAAKVRFILDRFASSIRCKLLYSSSHRILHSSV